MVSLTQYELNGVWSTTDYGDAFLNAVANETGALLDSIGKSYGGRDLLRLTVGDGSKLIIVSSGVHRSEPASREVALIKARDVAYNLEGKYDSFLADYKIMFVPTVNVDVETTRSNGQGININRDGYALETPEMRALMKVITDEQPDVYVDLHEKWGNVDRLEFIDTMALDPNADALVRRGNNDFEMFVRNELEGNGYITATYPRGIVGPGMTISIASMLGSVSMTPETNIESSSVEFRVNGMKEIFDNILEWYSSNEEIISKIKSRYNKFSLKPNENFFLLNGDNEYYANATIVPILTPKGYLLEDPESFTTWRNTYDITVNSEGFVPIEQRSGRLIPHLLDPQSDMKVASAIRIEPPEPEKRTDGRYTKVLYDEWREVFIKYM